MHCPAKNKFFPFCSALIVVVMFCSFAGCIEKTTHGSETVYRYASWTGPVSILAALAMFAIGAWFWRGSVGLGVMIIGWGAIILALITTGMYEDRVIVADDHFQSRRGILFYSSEQNIRYDDLVAVEYLFVYGHSKRYYLLCSTKPGEGYVVNVGTSLTRNAVPQILANARAKGIQVYDRTVKPVPAKSN